MSNSCCIVTEEYSGINNGGGIGACAHGLSLLLLKQGYAVDVLVTGSRSDSDITRNSVNISSDIRFLFLTDISRHDRDVIPPSDEVSKSYLVYRYLVRSAYEVVHFNDWLGTGFYCAMARRQGAFKSKIVTHLHGGSEWVRRYNEYTPEIEQFEREGIERFLIENSDFVVCPSAYLLEYYRNQGIALPPHATINWWLPQWSNLLDGVAEIPLQTRAVAPSSISELIFFGRHERRKGFSLFVDAVARLPKGLQPDITFIGRFDKTRQEFSGAYALRRLAGYDGRIRFFNNLNQEEAMSRIRYSPAALCVMPSLIENSPCVVGECFTIGVPFLTTNVGGTAELIDAESRAHCLVEPNVDALVSGLVRLIKNGAPPLKFVSSPMRIAQDWAERLRIPERQTTSRAERHPARPLISICLVHHERPALLHKALERLMAQTYDKIEIILVDDGSKGHEAARLLDELEKTTFRFPLKIIRSANRYLGAARNLAASHATGDYFLFHDDDNLAEPGEVETFVSAAMASGDGILTAQCWVFRSDAEHHSLDNRKIEFFPIGIGGIFSFFRNRFGDANALIARRIFESVGGFTELRGVGWEDWEFFLRAYLRGHRIGIVPEPLFSYRLNPEGMLATGDIERNYERLYKMIDEENPRIASDIFRYAQRDSKREAAREQLRAVLEREPAGLLHLALSELDPNSSEARVKLSELAFILGRYLDGVEIGRSELSDDGGSAAHDFDSHSLIDTAAKSIIVEPGNERDTPVIVLRGWGFGDERAYVPDVIEFNREFYQTVVSVAQFRSDVLDRYRLKTNAPIGFVLAAKRCENRSMLRRFLSRRKPLPNVMGYKMSFLPDCGGLPDAYIDNLSMCREILVKTPEINSWHGLITVTSDNLSSVFMKDISDQYYLGEAVSKRQVKFSFPFGKQIPSSIVLIIPHGGRAVISFT